MFLKNLIVGCIVLVLADSATSSDALPSGVMEGHLKILSRKRSTSAMKTRRW